MKKAFKFLINIFLLSVFIFIVFYFSGVFFYKNHFLPNTYINNINVQNKDIFEVKEILENELNAYKLSITGIDNKSLEIMGDIFNYKLKVNINDVKKVISLQSAWNWPFSSNNTYNIQKSINYDKVKLKEIIKNSNFIVGEDIKSPRDAYIEKTNNGYIIVKEDNGNKIEFEKLYELILSAVSSKEEHLILNKSDYLTSNTKESDENMVSFMKKAKKLNNLVIIYDFEDRKENLDFSVFKDWIELDESSELFINESSVKKYIINLANKYDTYQKERTFETTNNGEIKISGGIYGWQTNITETTRQLIEAIKALNSTKLKPIYKITAKERSIDDIGNTYIEINIKEQHMWFYKDGELIIDTDVVTGLSNGKRDTPTGIFTIWSRETNRYLRGANYKSWVNYWMPVSWDGIGIHDASWRSSFGGNIYKTNGSHGCINTPFSKVKKIYENIRTGTPVIIYNE